MNPLLRLRSLLLDLFFPVLCFGCRKTALSENEFLCRDCMGQIIPSNSFYCSECRKRAPAGKRTCLCKHAYTIGSIASYSCEPLQQLVKLLKYERKQKAAELLGHFLAEYIKAAGLNLKDFAVIPIPLSNKRLRERGFNQAELIAEHCLKKLNASVSPLLNVLNRAEHNKPQVEMATVQDRKTNVLNCFEVKQKELIKGKNVVLVDDVRTSGATMTEAVKTLRRAGAKRIIGLTIVSA